MINIEEIKKQLEKNKSFQYEKKEIGLSFEDFDLRDKETNKLISLGKKDIGSYTLYVKDGLIDSAVYDLNN